MYVAVVTIAAKRRHLPQRQALEDEELKKADEALQRAEASKRKLAEDRKSLETKLEDLRPAIAALAQLKNLASLRMR